MVDLQSPGARLSRDQAGIPRVEQAGYNQQMLDQATDAAFQRAIVLAPEDDAPRLVYADWLDELGDADRAEFIRLQIRICRLDRSDPEWDDVLERIRELRQEHHVEWVRRLPQFEQVHWEIFDRGFIAAARFDHPDAFFAHAQKVFRAAPIYELRLHQFGWPDAARLADASCLERVRILDLADGNQIGNQGLEGLMRSRHIAGLYSLKIGKNAFSTAGARAIAMAPYMRALHVLKLERNDLYDDGLGFLAGSANLAELRYLDLQRTSIGDDGLSALAASRHIAGLRMLDISNNQISAAGFTALMRSRGASALETLFVQGNRLGDRGVAALVEAPHMDRLERLYIRENGITDEGASLLANWPRARHLHELHLGGNFISDYGADLLRARLGRPVSVY